MAIIGISGKKQVGKDTIAKIIQYLIGGEKMLQEYNQIRDYNYFSGLTVNTRNICSKWQHRWFAEPLKDIVCLLIGCTREQLEDNDFKEKELGEEWRVYKYNIIGERGEIIKFIILTDPDTSHVYWIESASYYKRLEKSYILTPRKLLQLMGTECGRQIIHPNIWVNALMSEYKPNMVGEYTPKYPEYPNWVISDVRFPNEVKAIKDRGGVIIRVNRPPKTALGWSGFKDEHESETALDSYKEFDWIITNDGDLDSLIYKVKAMLEHFKII